MHDVFTSERALVDAGAVEAALGDAREARTSSIPACSSRPRASRPTIGSRGRRRCSARPNSATMSTGRCKKSDGSWTYFAADIAYHLDKYRRGFAELIDVWGADHGGYVKRMQAAVTALTGGKARARRQAVPARPPARRRRSRCKMSKRAGTFVTLREVVDEVGKDVVPLHHADAAQRPGARFRLRQGDGAVEGQSGLLRAIRPCARPLGAAPCARRVRRARISRPLRWPRRRSHRLPIATSSR